MKRKIAWILALALTMSLAACGKKDDTPTVSGTQPTTEATQPPKTTETTEPSETTIPAPTEPEWEKGTARAGYVGGVYKTFDAGERVKVIGSFRDYFVIEGEDVDLLVEQRLVRLDSEEAAESWDGYAQSGTEVYETVYGSDEPVSVLNQNTKVTVLEGKDDWLYIQWDGGKGYVPAEQISKWRISSGSGSGGSGGNAGGASGGSNSDGTDVPIGSLTSAEGAFGEELQLLGAYYGPEMDDETVTGEATILVQGTEGYLCLLVRDDAVKVTDWGEKTVTIWLGGEEFAVLPRWAVSLADDAPYESWTGYSKWNGVVYEEYQMKTEQTKLSTNKQVTVLDELPAGYVVEYEGQIGYMEMDKLSKTRISNGGTSGDGSGSGNSGATWTPPKM